MENLLCFKGPENATAGGIRRLHGMLPVVQ